jgi:REP element-mobilizing transposase RayT
MSRRDRKKLELTDNIYFITTTVMNFENILTADESYTMIVIDSIRYLLTEHSASLFAYVVMPNHIHLIIDMPEKESISDSMRDFKKYTTKEIFKKAVIKENIALINKLKENSNTGGAKLWMDRFDCQLIMSEKFLKQKINYIHNNPVKAGLIDEITKWPYSSARNYFLDDNSLINVSTDWERKI